MRLVVLDDGGELASQIRAFGWEIADSPHDGEVDAILAASQASVPAHAPAPVIQILDGLPEVSLDADDFILPPLQKEYLALRIASAQKRRAENAQKLSRVLHDLRSPLNAIQGYAELLGEEATGDAARYAARIRTAVELLNDQLRSLGRQRV
jgi:signal transduction histidine kinase